MTEAEWLACDDPARLLQALGPEMAPGFVVGVGRPLSDRKLRLFACACCRHIRHHFDDPRFLRAVEVAEDFADGLVDERALGLAHSDAYRALMKTNSRRLGAAARDATLPDAGAAARAAVESAAWTRWRLDPNREQIGPRLEDWEERGRGPSWLAAQAAARAVFVPLLRDLAGNPFRPVAVERAWLTRNDSAGRRVASAVYGERAFDRLPILADALEDGGCTDAQLLDHCRAGGEHRRGCWAVDLLLGLS
jgi:hypothetical protein